MIGEQVELAGLTAWRSAATQPVDPSSTSTPVIMLIHGALDRAASFGRAMRRLETHDVIAYDRRGYGASVRPGRSLGLHDDVEDLCAVLDLLGRPAVVVGHSFGGLVAAWAAASSHPGVVSIGMWETPDPRLAAIPGTPGGDALVAADAGRDDLAVETFFRRMVGDRAWDRLRPEERDRRLAEAPGLVADLRAAGHPASDPDWSSISVPVSVGLGGQSGLGFRAAAERFTAAAPLAELMEFPDASHGVHLARPGDFATFVQSCL